MYQILLVEDDRALALAVQKLLESYGSRVRCVEDFADVLGEFAACQPQLVLMDIKLPYRDGYYWCSRIREISAVPVVFLLLCVGQHEHRHGPEHGRGRLHRQACGPHGPYGQGTGGAAADL